MKNAKKKSVSLDKRGFLAQAVAALSLGLGLKKKPQIKIPAGSVVRAKNYNGEKIG